MANMIPLPFFLLWWKLASQWWNPASSFWGFALYHEKHQMNKFSSLFIASWVGFERISVCMHFNFQCVQVLCSSFSSSFLSQAFSSIYSSSSTVAFTKTPEVCGLNLKWKTVIEYVISCITQRSFTCLIPQDRLDFPKSPCQLRAHFIYSMYFKYTMYLTKSGNVQLDTSNLYWVINMYQIVCQTFSNAWSYFTYVIFHENL